MDARTSKSKVFYRKLPMLQETINQQWTKLQELARSEAKRLVDDFPDNQISTVSYPVIAEQFCQQEPPKDINEFQMRQFELNSLTSTMNSARLQFQTNRMARQIYG